MRVAESIPFLGSGLCLGQEGPTTTFFEHGQPICNPHGISEPRFSIGCWVYYKYREAVICILGERSLINQVEMLSLI